MLTSSSIRQNPSSAIKNEPKSRNTLDARITENSVVAFQNITVSNNEQNVFVSVRKINHITNSFSGGETMLSEGISIWNTPTFFGRLKINIYRKQTTIAMLKLFAIWRWMRLREKSGPKQTTDHSENSKHAKRRAHALNKRVCVWMI